MTEEEEFEFRARAEAEQGGRYVVDPNALQRRAGIRRARFKDENLAGNIGSGFLSLGEDVGRETTGALSNAGLSPAAANVGGFVADAGTNFLPMGGGAVAGAKVGAPVMEAGAKRLMQSSLKPAPAALAGGLKSDAAKAIQTMLDEGINVTPGGVAKMRDLVTQLNDDVMKQIAASPAIVDKAHAMRETFKVLQKFRKQVNPEADMKKVIDSWDEFNRFTANTIPIQEAQALKQGTYKILADKYARGGMPAVENEAATQAQMAQARGMRLAIEDKIPEVAKLNKRESDIINAIELAEKRAGIAGNRDIAGIAWLAQNPAAAAAMFADRSPLFKSILARMMYQSRTAAPATAGAYAAGASINEE